MDKQSAKEVVLARWRDARYTDDGYGLGVIVADRAIVGESNRKCDHEDAEELAWQSASLHQSVVGAESLYQCSYTASGEHAPSIQGDCIYCSCKGRDHKLRHASPAPQAEKDDLKEQVWQAYLRNENNMRLELNRLRNSAPHAEKVEVAELYYIQDARQFCGNSVFWWKPEGNGYTCDLDEAWKVTREKAESMTRHRPGVDVAWPVASIDAGTARHFDMQKLREMKSL